MNSKINQLGLLLSPSWLSGFAVVLAGLAIVLGAVAAINYGGSSFQQQLQVKNTQTASPAEAAYAYGDIEDRFAASSLISNIPLFIFWCAVGLVAYSFAVNLIRALRSVVDLEHEMSYVHTNRRAKLLMALGHLLIRSVALITLFLYLQLTIHTLIPYAVAVGYASTLAPNIFYSAGYLAWALLVMTICLHIHVILLRLLLLKPRAFGQISSA